jgi:hypothetical protein
MELVDRYLKTVGNYLPKEQKDDILREMSENIRSEVEDREKELGRPLTEAEEEELVKAQGNPLLVAGRYRQEKGSVAFGKQWIGPELFPLYRKVLMFNLGVSSVIIVVLFIGRMAFGQNVSMAGLVTAIFWQVLIQGGVITTIFSAVNSQLLKHPDRWDPKKPATVHAPQFSEESARSGAPRVPRAESVCQFIALGASIFWLHAVRESAFWVFGPASKSIVVSAVWGQVYWPLVAVALAGMMQAGINLFNPLWVSLKAWAQMGMNAVTLGVAIYLVQARAWFSLSVPDGTEGAHGRVTAIINQSVFAGLLIAVVILVGMLIVDVRQLVRLRGKSEEA